MSSPEYIQVRLLMATYDRLQAFLEARRAKARARPIRARPAMLKTRSSVADAIDELLFLYDNEEARKSAYSQKRAAERKAREDKPFCWEVNRMLEEGFPNGD